MESSIVQTNSELLSPRPLYQNWNCTSMGLYGTDQRELLRLQSPKQLRAGEDVIACKVATTTADNSSPRVHQEPLQFVTRDIRDPQQCVRAGSSNSKNTVNITQSEIKFEFKWFKDTSFHFMSIHHVTKLSSSYRQDIITEIIGRKAKKQKIHINRPIHVTKIHVHVVSIIINLYLNVIRLS